MKDKPEIPSSTLQEIRCVLLRMQGDDKLLKKALAFLLGLDSPQR